MKMKLKTIVALGLIGIMMMSFGLAAWKFRLDGNEITGYATSERNGMVQIMKEFDDINIMETTNHSVDFNTYAEIKNNNGNLSFILNITESRIDVDDECTDYIDDVTTTYLWNGDVVSDGDSITLDSGLNYLNLTATAVMQSCPQNVSVNWALV